MSLLNPPGAFDLSREDTPQAAVALQAAAEKGDMQTKPKREQSPRAPSTDPGMWKINTCCLKKKKKQLPVTPYCVYARGSILAAEGCSWVNLTFINIHWAQGTLRSYKEQSECHRSQRRLGPTFKCGV